MADKPLPRDDASREGDGTVDPPPARRFAELQAQMAAEHRLRGLTVSDRPEADTGARLIVDGRELLNFGGNDYLGLARDPAVIAGAQAAVARYGAGATGSRLLSGHMPLHAELEAALAALKNKPRALVFPSGYQAAVTLLATLSGLFAAPPPVLLDKLCHASLLDGCVLGKLRAQRFKHNQPADLESYLRRHVPRRCMVVVESIYSMDGDAAPLAEIHALCHRRGAVLVIDDAHGTGVLGAGGCGLTQPFSADDQVIVLGTLSKALGGQGGFVAADRWVVEALIQLGRGFLFSTGLNPAAAGAALAAVQKLPQMDAARARVAAARERLLAALPAAATTPASRPAAAIVPVVIGADARALVAAAALRENGLYVPAVRPPTVPPNTARLRISLSAAHTEADLARLMAGLRAQRLTAEA